MMDTGDAVGDQIIPETPIAKCITAQKEPRSSPIAGNMKASICISTIPNSRAT